uniref:Uncharacterized protein n=1 Tax=Panagrolaimus davidi TaxID=227884 RepID=A0A914PIE0_9BILA
MIYKFLLFATIFITYFTTNIYGNLCFNCITQEYQNIYDDYINTPGNEKMIFPSGKTDCNNSRMIKRKGECVGIKIEEFKKKDNGYFVGYIYGCAEHFFKRKILLNNPVPEAQKFCDKPNEFDISYSISVKTTFCRCKEEMCNNPGKDFVNSGKLFFVRMMQYYCSLDYVPLPSSQISSSAQHPRSAAATRFVSSSSATKTTSSSTTKAAILASIETNALAISLSFNCQIDPVKLILSNLLAYLIYQMF